MNYALSDIHGHLNEFNKMLELIDFNSEKDHLYILGDAIDKGEKSIEMLLKVMEMVKEGSATYLLGNHDHMMYDYLRKIIQGKQSCYQEDIWFINGGDKTLSQYLELQLVIQAEIYNFIKHLPVVIPSLKIADKEFYLVHSCPNPEIKEVSTMKELGYSLDTLMPYIWSRIDEYENDESNKYILAGHTICNEIKIKNYINLDCGCAANFRLGCLRLEDFKIFYVDCENNDNAELK